MEKTGPQNHILDNASPFQSNDVTPTIQQSQINPLQQQLQQTIKEDYEVLTKLGSGAYGHVWKVKDKKTQQVFALKKVFSAFQNQVDAQRTYREIYYLQKLAPHQNIIKLRKVIKATNDMDLYLLFQYMQSDLFYAIKQDLLNELHKKYIIYQLAKCLKYVHSAGLVHRDVKPSNILINPNCEVRLCDFGLSRTLWRYNNQEAKLTEFIATRWYRAPEVLFGSQFYSTKSDMWSLGCLIYELYARRPLLPGNDTVEQIQKVLEFKGFPNSEDKKSFRIPKIDEILGLFDLQKKPLTEYFKHIPFQEVKELLIHLLQYNPQKRWSATDLLNCSFLEQFREFQGEISAQKQIKTGINDNERKSVEVYRNVIYNAFVYDGVKKCQDITQKLQIIRDSRDSTHRGSAGRKLHERGNSQDLLTEQRKSRHFINTKSSASLHVYKGSNNSKQTYANTQRISHRKNMSTHSGSKFGSDVMEAFRTEPQKPLLTQMKLKKPQSKFQFSLNQGTRRTARNSLSKDNGSNKPTTTKDPCLPAQYPTYLRTSTHTSLSKIPKMIQQKLNHQRSLFSTLNPNTPSTIPTTRPASKLKTRASMHSAEKKSPYVTHLQENAARFQFTGMMGKGLGQGKGVKENVSGGGQGMVNGGGQVRKLKRKAVVN